MDGNKALSRGSATRACKYKPCSIEFTPKRITQVFCTASCKTKHTMAAYEVGLKVIEGKAPNFHFARLENSPQLQALHAAFLKRKGEVVTTIELFRETGLMSISTRVSELRANGIDISDAVYMGKSETGAKVFGYKLNS